MKATNFLALLSVFALFAATHSWVVPDYLYTDSESDGESVPDASDSENEAPASSDGWNFSNIWNRAKQYVGYGEKVPEIPVAQLVPQEKVQVAVPIAEAYPIADDEEKELELETIDPIKKEKELEVEAIDPIKKEKELELEMIDPFKKDVRAVLKNWKASKAAEEAQQAQEDDQPAEDPSYESIYKEKEERFGEIDSAALPSNHVREEVLNSKAYRQFGAEVKKNNPLINRAGRWAKRVAATENQ